MVLHEATSDLSTCRTCRADEKAIFQFFSKAGTVLDIQLITDKNTRRSRGMAYIEYATQEEVLTALTTVNGQIFMDMPVMVRVAGRLWDQKYQCAFLHAWY